MTTVNVSSISGRTVQVAYLGSYTGTVYPSVTMVSPITDDPASVAYQTTHPVVSGDIFEWDDVNSLNVSVDSSGLVTADIEGTFQGRWFDDGDQVYGDWETYTFAVPVADTVPDQFSVDADVTEAEPGAVVQRTFVLSGIDAGETVSPEATGSATVSPSTAQVGDTITVSLTAGTFEAVVTGGVTINGGSDSFSVTTRAAIVPVQDVVLPDLNLGETDAVSIDFDSYFSGARSYDVSGIPANSGLSFAGSVLSGNVNKEAIAASPFNLTVTAFGAEGNIQDVFSVTVVDDIAPVLTIDALTTFDTTPIVTGSAGDAASLALDVNGVDVVHTSSYTPAPSAGTWNQQLPELVPGTYNLTLNGLDTANNPAVEVTRAIIIQAPPVASVPGTGRRRGFLRSVIRGTVGSILGGILR